MQLLPSKKLFFVSYAIVTVLNGYEILKLTGWPRLIGLLLVDNLIYAILLIVLIRIAVWIGKKTGMAK